MEDKEEERCCVPSSALPDDGSLTGGWRRVGVCASKTWQLGNMGSGDGGGGGGD